MEAKQTVRELLDRLPDDSSVEDILYHLYVLHQIEDGRSDVQAGRVVPHEQVVREMRRKWVLGAA